MNNIKAKTFLNFDAHRVPSPCFVVDRAAVEANLAILARVQRDSGAKILAALKAFSLWRLGPLTSQYLSGTCASGLFEARLGVEEYGGETHTYAAAFKDAELPEILQLSDHVVFNSIGQWQRFQPLIKQAQQQRSQQKQTLRFGLRINPDHSEADVALYDPCAPKSRLGILRSEFDRRAIEELPEGISGLHFHTLCEQDVMPLQRTIAAVEAQFGDWLPALEWINFGGGHHITRPGYQVQALIDLLRAFADKYQLQIYLEPGEALAINTGVLVTEVQDVVHNQMDLAILDSSATCHMADILEMPYRAEVFGAGALGSKAYDYRLGGMTCLAGDVMGDYSFERPLQIGQRLIFDDMAHYTMVKTSTFNGIHLPAIALWDSRTDELEIVREFAYSDFKGRLA